MSEDLTENQEHNTLAIEYKDGVHKIPVIEDIEDVKSFIEIRLKPQLAAAILLNGEYEAPARGREKRIRTGVSFVEYIYQIDEQSDKSRGTLREMGMLPSETEGLVYQGRRPGLHPQLHTMVDGLMKEEPGDTNYDKKELPFENRTFVVGPLTIDWEAIDATSGPTFEEDEEACRFYPKGAFVIDGKRLMEISDFKRGGNDRITNADITLMLTKIGIVNTS